MEEEEIALSDDMDQKEKEFKFSFNNANVLTKQDTSAETWGGSKLEIAPTHKPVAAPGFIFKSANSAAQKKAEV
jgi:hypothetical protein